MRTRVLLLFLIVPLYAISLKPLWSFQTGALVSGIAPGEKYLGVSSWDGCLYFLDLSGKMYEKICLGSDVEDVDYLNGTFAAITLEGKLVFVNETTLKVYRELNAGPEFSFVVKLLPNGTLVCLEGCKYLDKEGNVQWVSHLGHVAKKPAYAFGYLYVPTWDGYLYIVKDGKVLNKISYLERVWEVSSCGKELAVSTDSAVYLYNLTDPIKPSLEWKVDGFEEAWSVSFSKDCSMLAIADACSKLVTIVDSNGQVLLKKGFDEGASTIYFKGNLLILGSSIGRVVAFELSPK
ncbi:hypothetical protein EYM_05615 [Ignicoccus islandicus DSM 13165]|uniref:Anaphase-promoting complex subunit 4 WD40 domain-containing protein n=1 Tax=Ignicoccus islandicus DSM 13165 TaxID=940295 RepID=A0A0U3FA98_9CREN|nr:WD40 repeat domain-containing protein [Ignicoccus islandicus]ALU12601.1 hypothetical protein EYM_05615 [Ignicoccus islandicus DSM 13165]